MQEYEIVAVQDKWSELLPPKIPLRYAFFRYLGFCIKKAGIVGTTSYKAMKLGARAALWVRVTSSKGTVFESKVSSPFSDGTYYVQDLVFHDEGLHTFTISVECPVLPPIKPLVLQLNIHQFMKLSDEESLQTGPYVSLRNHFDQLLASEFVFDENESGIDRYIKEVKHSLRVCDAKWWMRAFFTQGALEAQKQRDLKNSAFTQGDRSSRRKQACPIRSGDKRDHDGYFEGKQKDVKRQRRGEIRIFVMEALHANETHVVFCKRELHQQLALYSQR
ncbi:hypothetical protein THRCLA_20256 [Thraustotheca clavata]|uniref:Uncharacterized protein n=1 Tax=Thraustotheca clavata TaxID=74557 RepID=A0A1W0A9R6_9STRA|nr:hypothetical protein THRCLA_20256 [Thraustotheca clavata]